MPKPGAAAALAAALLVVVLAPHGAAREQASTWDVVVERDIMVAMRDGVRMALDLYRPARDGVAVGDRLPVLLLRTPYNKGIDTLVGEARAFASHGYVVAVQDIRGRYKSEGAFTKYADLDSPDGYDTIEWLAAQPFSDGQVGMWGNSYEAHTQADAAKLAPPHLKTIVLNMGGMANAWDHAVRHGGAFELGRELTWAFQEARRDSDDPVVRKHLEVETVEPWYSALPFRPGLSPLAAAPAFEQYILDEMTRSDYDAFWQRPALNWKAHYAETSDIPMLHIGGWYDIFLRGTVENYVALSDLKTSPVRLLIGPWVHSGNERSYAGDVEFGPDAAMRDYLPGFHLRWFDHFLKGRATGVERDKPVRIFVMGTGDGHKDAKGRLFHGGAWRDSDSWPLPGTTYASYYFQADGGLTTEAPPAVGRTSATTYTFDPARPVPTLGGSVSNRVKDGAYDQRERADFVGSRPPYLPLRSRNDVVVFQTPPLAEDVQVIGPIEVKVFVSSTAVDTDFAAKLVDVYPPSADFPSGFDMNLTDALVRASYRDDRTTRALITPGQVYELTIRPFPTANVFKKGHRIRVDISSSSFPRWDVNPNTGEPLGKNRRAVPADNTIYHDAARPSHIVLPIVPR
ncbi:MAG: CocE/NonD family hydrolase [Vicinamibacterales bacterium]